MLSKKSINQPQGTGMNFIGRRRRKSLKSKGLIIIIWNNCH